MTTPDIGVLTQRINASCDQLLLNKGKNAITNTKQMIKMIVDDINQVRRVNSAKADELTNNVLTKTCILDTDIEFDKQDKEYSRLSSIRTSSKVAPMGRKRRTKRHKR